MSSLAALLLILFAPTQDVDCGPDGRREMREVYRQTEVLIDQIEQERGEHRGEWTAEAMELRAYLLEKENALIDWVVKCQEVKR
jgi:hypothetical protein